MLKDEQLCGQIFQNNTYIHIINDLSWVVDVSGNSWVGTGNFGLEPGILGLEPGILGLEPGILGLEPGILGL